MRKATASPHMNYTSQLLLAPLTALAFDLMTNPIDSCIDRFEMVEGLLLKGNTAHCRHQGTSVSQP